MGFLNLFGKYDFSLKSEKLLSNNWAGTVFVAWINFVNDRSCVSFIEDLGDKAEAARYILEKPLKKQIVNSDGCIELQEVSNNEKKAKIRFVHILRIKLAATR